MNRSMIERDWKHTKKLKPELLNVLCARINKKSEALLSDTTLSDHEKFLKLYSHIQDTNEVVAECFDDWRRSTLFFRLLALQRHDLLKEEHIRELSDDIQQKLVSVKQLERRNPTD